MGAEYEIRLRRADGTALNQTITEFDKLTYTRAVNTYGELVLTMRDDPALKGLLKRDTRLEVWRKLGTRQGVLDTGTCWLLRRPVRRFQGGVATIELRAYSALHLLQRRVVAYPAGTSYTRKTNEADDMIKAIVRENYLAANIGTSRDGYSASDASLDLTNYLAVQADLAAGQSVTKDFARKNVLLACQEIARASADRGTPIFFDIVANGAALELRTYATLRGIDHSWPDGRPPLTLSPQAGNLDDVLRDLDWSNEVTVGIAAGSGLDAARTVGTATAALRLAASPFNRIEAVTSYSAARGDTTALDHAARQLVRRGRPRRQVTARIVETEQTRYGLHWGWGDKVSVDYLGEIYTATIDAVSVTVDGSGETIAVVIRLEDE